MIESEFPTQVERFELLGDSGDPGRHRGGLGFVREYRIVQDEVRFSMRTDKHAVAPKASTAATPAAPAAVSSTQVSRASAACHPASATSG